MPHLHSLTVRTSSVENAGLHSLWPWIRQLAPKCSLQALTLHSVVIVGEAAVQRGFLMWLAEVHAKTMKRIILGSTMVDMGGLRLLCEEMRGLEELVCSVESVDAVSVLLCDSSLSFCLFAWLRFILFYREADPFLSFPETNQRSDILRTQPPLATTQLPVVSTRHHLFVGTRLANRHPFHSRRCSRVDASSGFEAEADYCWAVVV